MPTTRRMRTIAAPPAAVWRVVKDPNHMPRWWPKVSRMEGVDADRFTQVIFTKKGRPVRIDFRLVDAEPPSASDAGRVSWEQELAGTPFERHLHESVTEVELEAAELGTLVTIAQRHKLRGYSRYGGLMFRRATRERLDGALDGLARIWE